MNLTVFGATGGVGREVVTQALDTPATGTVRAGYLGRARIRASITRADIANFLLDQTTDARFHRAAPAISN
jgi:nucleoside-diphosphate-sugar epimerase